MGVNIMCLTSSGGLPLFSRKLGNVEALSFSTIGSLNGVHMFTKSHGVTLESTETENTTVLWKEFEDSVVLIAVAVLNDKEILNDLLDSVFSAMVLCVGIDEIKNIRNVERFKRELRIAYAIVDSTLECLDFADHSITNSHDILKYVETILCAESESLQTCLDVFVDSVCSMFGCLTIENCIAVATEGWWELTPIERKLLSHVLSNNSNCTAFDIPVFLPCKSPTVPFRLVSICLISSIWVSVLCGPTPDLSTVEQMSYQSWSPMITTLRSAAQTYPRNIPNSIQIQNSVMGILLINISVGKYLSCTNLTGSKRDQKSSGEVLKTFFYQAANLLIGDGEDKPIETYWCAEYHKVHAMKEGDNMICLMYNSTVPTHTMRLISQQTLSTLTSENELRW